MNIFLLHIDPKKCAQMHVDKHVVKMILESVQLLCSAHHLHNSGYTPPYKLTHKNHPCAIWVRTSASNYKWLCNLFAELCAEYTHRYGKIHKCQSYLEELTTNIPAIPDIGLTTFALAMPEHLKSIGYDKTLEFNSDMQQKCVESYRNYYNTEKTRMHSWKKRDKPEWILS